MGAIGRNDLIANANFDDEMMMNPNEVSVLHTEHLTNEEGRNNSKLNWLLQHDINESFGPFGMEDDIDMRNPNEVSARQWPSPHFPIFNHWSNEEVLPIHVETVLIAGGT